ncbi:hypothetical protein SAMN05443549_102113 [Flavobacterium fluvii]|uniref:ABC-2 family transporter protein n=1 Tax=Flavobacterium fluvii TaxID=468056 RepID=A0A1M5H7V9_9FLAO|nr:hypothetical protein [Flavobacterium fluvii]SHG11998.1 hypothetical protein SAMN05443549_102113 [Flavobacterium fluvii]
MSFNTYFNLNRFARLFQQDLLINRTKYLLTLAGLGLVAYLLSYMFLNGCKDSMIKHDYSVNQNYTICFVFFMMAVGVVIGTAFPDLSDKIKASNYLLNPGSTLEKVVLQFLIRIGLFVPIALVVFWITICLAKASLSPGDSGLDPSLIPYFEFRLLVTNSADKKIWDTWQILFVFFGLFSYGIYLFAGATYFKRYALVKTVIASVVILLISITFSVVLSHIFYPKETEGFNTKLNEFVVTDHLTSIELFMVSLSLFSWLFFLVIAYFKLKEKEA